jgi:hypothetical protein
MNTNQTQQSKPSAKVGTIAQDGNRVLSDRQVQCFVELLWDLLKGDPEHKDRVKTGWGTKTKVGLIACIERIIEEE